MGIARGDDGMAAACWERNREFASKPSLSTPSCPGNAVYVYTHPSYRRNAIQPYPPPWPTPDTPPYLDLEPEPGHAAAVQVDGRLAVLLGVGGVGEEHALVALGLFVLAHAARLLGPSR